MCYVHAKYFPRFFFARYSTYKSVCCITWGKMRNVKTLRHQIGSLTMSELATKTCSKTIQQTTINTSKKLISPTYLFSGVMTKNRELPARGPEYKKCNSLCPIQSSPHPFCFLDSTHKLSSCLDSYSPPRLITFFCPTPTIHPLTWCV